MKIRESKGENGEEQLNIDREKEVGENVRQKKRKVKS